MSAEMRPRRQGRREGAGVALANSHYLVVLCVLPPLGCSSRCFEDPSAGAAVKRATESRQASDEEGGANGGGHMIANHVLKSFDILNERPGL